MSHLEVIGTIVAMLNKGAKDASRKGPTVSAALPRDIGRRNDSHVTQVLYGGGPAFTNSGGIPGGCIHRQHRRSHLRLALQYRPEARAKIIYERLINCTNDPGVKEALGFLMTARSLTQSFEKALYSIQPNFPPGKLAGMPQFANVYFNMSTGDGDARGPWNKEPTFEYREAQPAVDGGDGLAASPSTQRTLS